MVNGAQIMVKCLEKEGVKVVFGYPGAAICPFYDELYQSEIHHILSGRSRMPDMPPAAMPAPVESPASASPPPAPAPPT